MVLVAADGTREQARSMTVSRNGMVATSQTTASQAGAYILDQGGSAVDAAIAANAVLNVTEPGMNGIGGDLFAIVYDAKSGKLYGLNASGWAPKELTIEFLKSKGITGKIPIHTIQAVTVPGAVSGWDALSKRFGRLPLATLLAPAIEYAENGVPIAERASAVWLQDSPALMKMEGFAQTFAPGGHGPATGDIFRDPDLAKSLRRIAAQGRDGFYKGETAEALVRFSHSLGGVMSAADLAEFQPEWVDPISTTYRGWRVFELPPNGQGIAALSMLNIMENFPLAEYGHNSTRALHAMIEAKKLAYADLQQFIGDPHFSKIPVEHLLSKKLGKARADLIRPDMARCEVAPSDLNEMGRDTTYLTASDREGNIVSLIQSNFEFFGTGLVAPGTGFVLHNRGSLFELTPGKPNSLEPRKRPLHTIIPGFMEKGPVKMGFGIMGGFNQAQAHAQFVSNVVDYGMNVQAALEAARFSKRTFEGCDVEIESGVPEKVREELTKKGHVLTVKERYSERTGRGNAILIDGKAVQYGGSDPRGDGSAVPASGGWLRKK